MTSPKFHLLYFKNVLERCFLAFVGERQDCFKRSPGGKYVFAEDVSRSALVREFSRLAASEIRKYVREFDVSNPEYFFIIGGCDPKDNILLAHRSRRFPAKLAKLLDSDRCLKYLFREKDVDLDIEAFNSAFESVFESMFSGKNAFEKLSGGRKNVFFVRHSRLDCYSMFKVLKYLFGPSNCVNVYAERFEDRRQLLVAVNDLIDRYSVKSELNSSLTFKKIVKEVGSYVDGLLGIEPVNSVRHEYARQEQTAAA